MAKAEYKSAVRSRKLIRGALAELLHEKPLDKITVTDVVKRANINRGTFYAHYLDIPDVIDKQVENTCALMQESMRCCKSGERPDPSLFLKQLQEMIEEEQEFYQNVLTSNIALPIIERLRNIFWILCRNMKQNLALTAMKNIFPESCSVPAEPSCCITTGLQGSCRVHCLNSHKKLWKLLVKLWK